jgi:hypothetical protein
MSSSLSDSSDSARYLPEGADDVFDDFDDEFDEDFEEETVGEYEPATEYVTEWERQDPSHSPNGPCGRGSH